MAGESSHGGKDSNDPSRRASSASDVDADNLMTQVLNSRSEEYRLLFRLPQSDELVQDFNCALHENFLIQGHMYLFVHHICFYANIFGFETKKTIAIHEITMVRKAKTAGIFPNAIEIMVGEKKHFFGSFLSRDEAYRLIVDGWSQHSSDAKKFLDPQDSKTDNSSPDNTIVTVESVKDSKQPADDLNFTDSMNTIHISLPDGFSEIQANGVESLGNASLGVSSVWQIDDVDAPKVPEHFTLIAEAKFPVGIEDFFHYLFSDDAIDFFQTFRRTCGDTGFKCTPWRRHEQFGHVRDLSFDHPVKILFVAFEVQNLVIVRKGRSFVPIETGLLPTAVLTWVGQIRRARTAGLRLVIETSQQISDVPFGDYFHVQGLWDVEQDGTEESNCHMKVYINVVFSRKLLWKGKIEQSTQEECREARELLKQKIGGKEQDVPCALDSEASDTGGLPKLEGPSEHSPVIMFSKRMPMAFLDFRDLCSQICGPIQEALRSSTCVLTIILLLSKSPRIHIVSQGNYINSLGGERSESIRWLEERVHNLNQEMQLMEGRLERMRHEYMFLRTHLQDLHMLRTES
ncbi:hypothetical protein Taro_012964 [Colocasia esculenta]|uniref:VASt domain-containing protein n=1 Tax=Colocasia esculenta TaxID=4460 RepID=A0A843UKT2_COLES|nr:hypothetical protein [Colocasia esculenta]